MPIITSIKPQNNKKRVNIYIDGKFGFGLDLETFLKNKLKVEQQLLENDINKIIREGEFQKVYDKILNFASLRPRSENEFRKWLKKHKVHISLHEELFNRLKHLDFLNDKKFAVWWVEQRQTFRPKSKRILNQELRFKGINKEVIEDVLSETHFDESTIAKNLLEKKRHKWKNLEGFEARKKMSQFLLSKGFSWNIISKVVKEILIDD
ncbi:hypothetical protein A2159_00890 [Candidatus Woesebacteria bacterium RBG_13_34_9]|uniref:Regulatory protein RecX n=1 Tax=Candidatus Woesebacteria bacterium RBG_13_34_9 TaxID=1802477 RepID=A0A1F7X313_9BACT|nr:MAG: hypothetical protein A2159_00890 [Candidatus Woesebacteria bacterium RBG_13_34_9]